MNHNCNICRNKSKLDLKFHLSAIDAIGFILLMAICAVPVSLASYVVANIITMIDPIGLSEDSPLHGLSVLILFLLYFYKFGNKIANFMSLFVNYNFCIKSHCKKCNVIFWQYQIPNNDGNLNI